MARAGKKKGRLSKKQRLRLAARAAGASTDGADVDASNGETDAGQQRGGGNNRREPCGLKFFFFYLKQKLPQTTCARDRTRRLRT